MDWHYFGRSPDRRASSSSLDPTAITDPRASPLSQVMHRHRVGHGYATRMQHGLGYSVISVAYMMSADRISAHKGLVCLRNPRWGAGQADLESQPEQRCF
jgi:hypothetical protein